MATIEQLYSHLETLNKQWFYDKGEIDTALEAKADVEDIPDVSDVIRTSNTTGLVKNDGSIDTTTYLSESDAQSNYIAKSQTSGLVKNDGTIDTSTYLTEHQDISGKANSADLATVATSGSYTDLSNIPETFAPTAHEHSSADVKDSNAHTNLGTSANASQSAINTAIDTKIGSLLAVELLEVVGTRPTASADTMNKLYLVAEEDTETEDAYEIFVTVRSGTSGSYTYAWEKVDTARIDLSNYAAIDHTHGNLTNDGKIGSTADYFVYTSTGGAVDAKQKIGNITTSGAIGNDSGKVVVTTTSGVLTTSDWVTEVDNVIQNLTTYGNNLNS